MNYPKIWHGNNSLNYNWKSKSNRYKVWHIQLHKNKCFTFNPQELHQAHFADAKSEILKIYLFIYLFLAVLGLRFCARAFSSCGKRGPLFIAVSGPLTIAASLLRSTGSSRAGSVVVAHGPSCSAACGIFPDQGSNPCPLHWQADSQPLHHQGSPKFIILLKFTVSKWQRREIVTYCTLSHLDFCSP